MIICTSICNNYLPKAITLAQSIKKNCSDAFFVVCLTERELNDEAKNCSAFDACVLSKDLGFEDFDRFIYKHSIVEASTAVKGQLFKYLIKTYGNENKFIYLDPDIYVYDNLVDVSKALDEHGIVLCPHVLKPGNIEMELSSLMHGVYNLGFLAINSNHPDGVGFIDYWTERLKMYCYDDIPNGIFTDQKWVDLAPCFFDTYILKHPGYDYAIWSIMNSHPVIADDGSFYIDDMPLHFIHYSGFDTGLIQRKINEWMKPQDRSAFQILYDEYSQKHAANDEKRLSEIKWSYGEYFSKQQINAAARIYWRDTSQYKISGNPFAMSDYEIFPEIPKPKKLTSFIMFKESLRKYGLFSAVIKGFAKIFRGGKPTS